ncbi:MAG: hypothetical protein PWP51_134 [Clostridiales bacterium]|jgi:HD-like signal output (HDOD) protein|nr:hypothetical protein [Clostridiales bacterium]MDN5297581.1 hypothetical protein [Clostridiales bacterium]
MKKIMLISKDIAFFGKFERRFNPEHYTIKWVEHIEASYLPLEAENFNTVIVDIANHDENEQYLKFLQKHYPKIIRINIENHQYGMEFKGNSHAQMSWRKNQDISELVLMVLKLIEIDERINNAELLNLVSNLRHLPTLPKIYTVLTSLIENNASVEEISLQLESDPAIATNVLKLANSAFYNAKTGSIRQAIMYIGLNNVKNIILTNAVFDNNGLDPEFKDVHWRHVNYANKILNAMYIEVLGKKLNNNISAVGLLHDVGNIVLMCNFPQLLKDILMQSTDHEIYLVEKEQIGFSHEELGGHLLDLWGLPMPVIEVALYHHDPLNKNIVNRELIMSMHIADYYAWKIVGADDADLSLNALVFSEMGIPKSVFDAFYEQFKMRDLG